MVVFSAIVVSAIAVVCCTTYQPSGGANNTEEFPLDSRASYYAAYYVFF